MCWSLSRSGSAARQLQAISNNLVGWSFDFVCNVGFSGSYPLSGSWASNAFFRNEAILSLHERILEESKRRDRRNVCGLLREIQDVERRVRIMNELTDFVNFLLTEKKEREVRSRVREVGSTYEGLKDGLDPLERLVREVFRRIMRIRTDGLDSIGRVN